VRRPVIANRVGEIPYFLGDHATYVEPTPKAFADAIEAFMRQPHPPDVDYDLSQLSWEVRAKQLLEALSRPSNSPARTRLAAGAASPAAGRP
jgi:hypothetical protein